MDLTTNTPPPPSSPISFFPSFSLHPWKLKNCDCYHCLKEQFLMSQRNWIFKNQFPALMEQICSFSWLRLVYKINFMWLSVFQVLNQFNIFLKINQSAWRVVKNPFSCPWIVCYWKRSQRGNPTWYSPYCSSASGYLYAYCLRCYLVSKLFVSHMFLIWIWTYLERQAR